MAERDLAGSIIYGLFGPGLTGNLIRARAKAIFYELDIDGSGGLTPDELQDWFKRYDTVEFTYCLTGHDSVRGRMGGRPECVPTECMRTRCLIDILVVLLSAVSEPT
jgi:hypothetical protein